MKIKSYGPIQLNVNVVQFVKLKSNCKAIRENFGP